MILWSPDQGSQQVHRRGFRRRPATRSPPVRLQGREDLLHPGRVQRHGVELPRENEHAAGQRRGQFLFFVCSTGQQSNKIILMLGSNSVRQIENRDRERTFVYVVQLAHRGRGEKKTERRIGINLTSCTGKTERYVTVHRAARPLYRCLLLRKHKYRK